MDKNTDNSVVIIGAGYAGLAAGIALVKKKIKTTIVEKSSEIGFPIRCGGGSWLEDLEKLNIPEEFMHPVKNVTFFSPKHKACFKSERPLVCVLNTVKVLKYLEKEFIKYGGNILLNHTALSPVQKNNTITGINVFSAGENKIINADIFIDASGFSSTLARKVKLRPGSKRFAIGGEYDLLAPGFPQDTASLIVGYNYLPSGYGWIAPCGNNKIRVGIGLINPKKPVNFQACIKDMIEQLNKEGTIHLTDYKILEYHHGIISCDKPLRKTIQNGLITIGDSAGQISLLLGEGTRHSLEIGQKTGDVLADHLHSKNSFNDFTNKYTSLIRSKYYYKFLWHYYINIILSKLSAAQFDKMVKRASKVESKYYFQIFQGTVKISTVIRLILRNPKIIFSMFRG